MVLRAGSAEERRWEDPLVATSRKLLPLLSVLLVLSSSFGVRAVHAAASGDRDGDGISDVMEGTADTDHDGIANDQDADSDNDGIPVAVDAALVPATALDGVHDDEGGAGDDDRNYDDPAATADSDHDGTPDYRDTDSDNDGIPDGPDAN